MPDTVSGSAPVPMLKVGWITPSNSGKASYLNRCNFGSSDTESEGLAKERSDEMKIKIEKMTIANASEKPASDEVDAQVSALIRRAWADRDRHGPFSDSAGSK
jgi:hypothetical protein